MDKLRCGGRFFTNPHREDKRDPDPWAFGESMGACRGYTLCETFKDWDDCTFRFFEITCPECMETYIYRKWLRAVTLLRLSGDGWDYKLLHGVKIDMYMNQDWREKSGALNYD